MNEALKNWFQDLTKQANKHPNSTGTGYIRSIQTKQYKAACGGDLMLIDVSLREAEKDGKCRVIDFSIVTPA